jgi:hypothetical protein
MTHLEVLLLILLAGWALGKLIDFVFEHRRPERPRPEPLFTPQLSEPTKIESFGGIPNKQVRPAPNSRCEICEGGFGADMAFCSGMANDARLVCSSCRDLMISVSRSPSRS